ncbi:Protein CBG25833 [Caenorhabditis briggsae]|uniref:Protein CBG25833 n=1 Tax=Caenorhabditis briggsae TaxID=6238 RepID=B6IKK7_CAEBR|nr:Protein CBG25833 [Caenorhabditis briggsae]CAS00437.1 Protein CBG25833 [Caenorhabditis briggsae]
MDANIVKFPNSLEFILGKNPTNKEETRVFWHMIKDLLTEQMFMASGFEEGGKTVCYKYIPLKEGEIVRVGSFEIKCTEYKEFANGQVVRRKLEVKYSDLNPEKEVSFTVEHVQYAKSTDGDLSECPMNPKIFSNLVRIARKNKKPVIIHCRDGVNRSGAFFADVEWLIQKFGKKTEEGKKMEDIDFVDELQSLRKMTSS